MGVEERLDVLLIKTWWVRFSGGWQHVCDSYVNANCCCSLTVCGV